MEQRFKKCLHFEETSEQDNPYLLRVGALKIYCEHKSTAKAVFFLRSSVSKKRRNKTTRTCYGLVRLRFTANVNKLRRQSFFYGAAFQRNGVLQFNYFFSCTLTVFGVIIIYIAL